VLCNQTDFYKPPSLAEVDMMFLRDLAAPYPSLRPSIVNFIARVRSEVHAAEIPPS
jgi:hypothetical protein